MWVIKIIKKQKRKKIVFVFHLISNVESIYSGLIKRRKKAKKSEQRSDFYSANGGDNNSNIRKNGKKKKHETIFFYVLANIEKRISKSIPFKSIQ